MIGEKNSGLKDKICTLGAAEGGEPHVESCRSPCCVKGSREAGEEWGMIRNLHLENLGELEMPKNPFRITSLELVQICNS